jgi:quercetin dioxygenase-like cupin family protein
MRWSLLAIVFAALGAGGMSWAHHEPHGKDSVKVLARKQINEKLDGKATTATTVEVTLGPGESDAPHRHPGPGFGYILEGEYEWAIDDNPARILKVGDTFYEPALCLHRVSRNPSKTGKTRILATVLHPADIHEIVIPEKGKKD